MNVGSGNSSGEPEAMMEINTTPLIDVMLVLLVMLIITIPIQLHAVNLEMPVGAPPSANKPEVVKIDIDERSIVYWQGVPVAGDELQQKMVAAANQNPQPEVHLRPNKLAKYQVVANVLSSTKRNGLTKLAVIGAEQFVQ
jgi:biopolymer transport protein ExbD